MEKEVLLEKITYWLGYFKGASNILRSAGDIDPLALSGDFEDVKRDLGIIRQGMEELFKELGETNKKKK